MIYFDFYAGKSSGFSWPIKWHGSLTVKLVCWGPIEKYWVIIVNYEQIEAETAENTEWIGITKLKQPPIN